MWERTRHGAVDIVIGSQPVDRDTVGPLRRIMEECVGSGQPRLVFDAAEVPLFDSAGIELLLDIREACLQRGGEFQLAALNPLCLDILNATGVAELFDIFDDSVVAAGSFAQ